MIVGLWFLNLESRYIREIYLYYRKLLLSKKAYVILEDLQLTTEDKAKLLESLLQEPLPVDNCSPSLNDLDPLLSSYEEISLVITDNWLSWFVEAKGCFGISLAPGGP
jgi:hypothetical protein